MIELVEIINQPYSGEYEERIYDNQSPWNPHSWTYVKFTNSDYDEWCGVFRGHRKKVGISKVKKEIMVLTSHYLWRLNIENGIVLEIEDQPSYQNLTVAPNGDFVFADYYHINRINGLLKNRINIISPVEMDMIKFKEWDGDKLIIECDEFMNWENHLELELDSTNWEIEIKNATK